MEGRAEGRGGGFAARETSLLESYLPARGLDSCSPIASYHKDSITWRILKRVGIISSLGK